MSRNNYDDLIISEIIKKQLEHDQYNRQQIQLEVPRYEDSHQINNSKKEVKEPRRVIIIDI